MKIVRTILGIQISAAQRDSYRAGMHNLSVERMRSQRAEAFEIDAGGGRPRRLVLMWTGRSDAAELMCITCFQWCGCGRYPNASSANWAFRTLKLFQVCCDNVIFLQ